MRQVREVLRLTTAGVGLNEIARRVGVAPSTVRLTLKRVAIAGLSSPLPAEMTDTALEAALFATVGTKQGYRRLSGEDATLQSVRGRCGRRERDERQDHPQTVRTELDPFAQDRRLSS